VSTTDPESRIMAQPKGGFAPAYNLQLSTDAHEKAIIAVALSPSPNDRTLLPEALDTIEATAGSLPAQLVVDQGFTTRAAILAADEKGIDLIGPVSESSARRIASLRTKGITEDFSPDRFRLAPERNCLICPQGHVLPLKKKTVKRGKTLYYYQGKDCGACPSKPSCCPKSRTGRIVERLENDPRVTAFLAKMETDEAKEIYKQRAEVAEFPNAWIKDKFGLRQFHLRGLLKAETEAFWACLTYNIKLWIRLCWRPRLTTA
jgi:hypothetical protein